MRRLVLAPKIEAALKSDFEGGEPLLPMARAYGCSTAHIVRLGRERGWLRPGSPRVRFDRRVKQMAVTLINSGFGESEVAQALGTSHSSVSRWVEETSKKE